MVYFTTQQVREIMDRKDNIRNMTVIAHVDHGKTTLTDSLVQMAGIIASKKAGEQRFTDTRPDEQERCITIKSTAVSMYYELTKDQIDDIMGRNMKVDGKGFLVNLIDSPGHVDFSSEVTAALRVTDGALVVVDAISSVCVQTETVLRQAITERVKPVLFINKIDKAILTVNLSPEDLYIQLNKVVESVNAIISCNLEEDSPMGNVLVDPRNGSVGFGSGLQSWAFDIPSLARYFVRSTMKPDEKPEDLQRRANKLAQLMWGDNFYNSKENKWSKTPKEGYMRSFNFFVLEPIRKIFDACDQNDNGKLKSVFKKFAPNTNLTDDVWEMDVKTKFKTVMNKWSPSGKTLLYMIAVHLPSPVIAQKYRMELLYEGPANDEAAIAIKNCDPNSPVMMYVSKMIPTGNKDGFFAFGRVFAGTIGGGQEIRILGPNFEHGTNKDVVKCNLQRACIMIGKNAENLTDIPCGNIAALVGVDKYLKKSGTITTFPDCWNIRTMKFSVSPVVRVAVTPVNSKDLPKLITGLTRLSKSDPMVQCYSGQSGEHIIAGAGELHLEICLKDLEEDHAGIPIKKSDPVVQYKETVSEPSSVICLAKSSNKHNRIFATAQPLDEEITNAIDDGKIKPNEDVRKRARFMADKYNFDVDQGRKIWCFGPDGSGPNLLIDSSKSVQFLNEIKDHVLDGFHQATSEGVLCNENMRGVRFDLIDVVLHADSIHRGSGQIAPCAKKVFLAAQRAAQPRLVEPVFSVEVECDIQYCSKISNILMQRRGCYTEEVDKNSFIRIIKGYLPVNESFGFDAEIKQVTQGHGFPQCVFDHWQTMNDDPYHPQSKSNVIILKTRQRKGMPTTLLDLNHYNESL